MFVPIAFAALLFSLPAYGMPAPATPVAVYAPVEAPYQFLDSEHRPDGFAVEVVRMVLREVGSDAKIELMPWMRIKAIKVPQPNQLIFTVYRNRETEHGYKWVGAIVPFRVFLYRLKSRPDVVRSDFPGLSKYTIGVVRGGGRFQYLSDKGLIRSLSLATSDESNLRKFFAGRIDILPEDPNMLRYAAKRYGLDFDKAEIFSELPELAGEGYLAFTLGTPDAVVQTYIAALSKVQNSKAYADLRARYDIPRLTH